MTAAHQTQRPWTDAEEATVRMLYGQISAASIGQMLGRTRSSVKNRIVKLGIGAGRNSGCFLPGQAPWNKGTHFVAGGRSAETRFKKGRPAHEARNYVPIGSYRISRDGYIEQKTTDDPSLTPTRRWVAVHRLVWIAAHGPVPAGHIVVFKKGMHTADPDRITLDLLECISRIENMRRNTYHNYGPDVIKAVQLRGAITRQINKREGKTA